MAESLTGLGLSISHQIAIMNKLQYNNAIYQLGNAIYLKRKHQQNAGTQTKYNY